MNTPHPIRDDPEFRALLALSARVGADPLLTQGAGGNTSLKRDGVLWIKASGTWLAHALDRDIMVPVNLAPLLDALDAGEAAAERAEAFVVAAANPSGLRPSIETTVHALLPQAVVVHVHSVETIAWACLEGGAARLSPLLHDFAWTWVPYARPGLPLARAIAARKSGRANVLVLGNHGLVVAGETVAEAEALLGEVVERLRRPARRAPAPDLARLQAAAAGAPYRPARHAEAHAVATDPVSRAVAAGGSLYPDHVIFLGPGAYVLPEGARADRLSGSPTLLLVPNAGVLLREGASAGADEMARCLADVTARIGRDDRPVYLSDSQEDELVNWDAEKYRQALNAAGRSA